MRNKKNNARNIVHVYVSSVMLPAVQAGFRSRNNHLKSIVRDALIRTRPTCVTCFFVICPAWELWSQIDARRSEARLRVLRDSGDGSGGSGMTLLCGAKHESLIDRAQALHLGLGLLESRLQLVCSHLKILDVGGGAIK